MPPVLFEKAVVTCTFLVTLDDISLDELKRATAEGAQEADLLKLEQHLRTEVSDVPQFWAEAAVDKLFQHIILKTRPQGVVVAKAVAGEEADAPHVATLRQKIGSGEKSGNIVTARLQITRENQLPFPGFFWLTSQIRDEPGNGRHLIYLSGAQVPA
jgi:hypothetical protein